MTKFLFDLVQIAIAVNLICIICKWVFFRKKGKKKGIVQKLVLLISRKIHHSLDKKLKAQKESLAPSVITTQKQSNLKAKVVPKPMSKVSAKIVPLKARKVG